MSAGNVLILVCGVLLAVSALLVLIRVIRGPSVLDRTVAMEVMISIMVCSFGLEAAVNKNTTTLPILVSLALLGFVGSVAVARFVARDHDRGSDKPRAGAFIAADGADAVTPEQAGRRKRRHVGGPEDHHV